MKTVNVRELRNEIPRLKDTLAREHELLLVSNGEPVARILPLPRQRLVPSLATHRASMPILDLPLEDWVRAGRDER